MGFIALAGVAAETGVIMLIYLDHAWAARCAEGRRPTLRDLYEDYAAAIDDMRLEDWAGFFTEDAVYKVMGRETFDQGLTHATIYCEGAAMIRDRAAAVRSVSGNLPRVNDLSYTVSMVRKFSSSTVLSKRRLLAWAGVSACASAARSRKKLSKRSFNMGQRSRI